MAAACHDLRPCLPVLHPFRLPFPDKVLLCPGTRGLPSGTMSPDGLVLLREYLPTQADPHLVNGLRDKSLDMETVIDKHRFWKCGPRCHHHGRGQVRRHGPDLLAYLIGDSPQHGHDGIRGHASDHRSQRPLTSVGGLVGKDGIDLAV